MLALSFSENMKRRESEHPAGYEIGLKIIRDAGYAIIFLQDGGSVTPIGGPQDISISMADV